MTKDNAIKLALEALEPLVRRAAPWGELDWLNGCKAITALREALAEQPAPVIQKSCKQCAHQYHYEQMTGPCGPCRFYSNFALAPQPAQQEPVTEFKSPGQRWEDGDDHDSRSEALYKFIAYTDFKHCGDSFCFKSGGDGDNGETLMFILDCWFAQQHTSPQPAQQLVDCHVTGVCVQSGLRAEQPAQQCKWPTCQREDYQQALAEQIKRELVGEQPPQRKPLPKNEWPKHPSSYWNDEYIGFSKSDLTNYAMQVLAAHNIKEKNT